MGGDLLLTRMLELEVAQERILSRVQPLASEIVPLAAAAGRFLAQTIVATVDLPGFDNSAMDGYAVRAEDVTQASSEHPVPLRVLAKVAAGESSAIEVTSRTCIRLFTGSPLPHGADAVVMQEDTRLVAADPHLVHVLDRIKPCDNIRFRGEDVKAGSPLFEAGQAITAARIALGAAAGVAHVTVAKRPTGGQVLFTAGFDGLFTSTDGGNVWREVQTLTDYVVGLDVSPDYADDATVIATTYVKGAYLSKDRGATWNDAHVGLGAVPGNKYTRVERLHNVHFSPDYANDGTIFSATWTNLLRSTDRGVSWSRIAVGTAPAGTLRQFVIAPSPAYASDLTVYVGTRQGEIYRSTARGAASPWAATSPPSTPASSGRRSAARGT